MLQRRFFVVLSLCTLDSFDCLGDSAWFVENAVAAVYAADASFKIRIVVFFPAFHAFVCHDSSSSCSSGVSSSSSVMSSWTVYALPVKVRSHLLQCHIPLARRSTFLYRQYGHL